MISVHLFCRQRAGVTSGDEYFNRRLVVNVDLPRLDDSFKAEYLSIEN